MASELPEHGYELIRQYIDGSAAAPDPWDYIGLFNDSGNEILRVSVTGDSRTSWGTADGGQTLVVSGSFEGADSDVPLDTTFAESRLFTVSGIGNGQAVSQDTFAAATIASESDTLVIDHTVEVPQV